MFTAIVHSNFGDLKIDKHGRVLEGELHESSGPTPTRFDTAEFAAHYGKLDSEIDLCDIGYWLPDGSHSPASEEFREIALREGLAFDPTAWVPVVHANEVDADGDCPACGVDYADCPCPGPGQEDEFEYADIDGVLHGRRHFES